jgi:hypothetical protein
MMGTTSLLTRRSLLRWLATAALVHRLPQTAAAQPTRQPQSTLDFTSSDTRLVEGFRWARAQALAYVRDSPAIGPWYEAALPGRNAFCMRDVSHMSTGAQFLGLAANTRNMLRQFALHISAAKKWCSWWEITGDGQPAPVDYKSDRDFWYDLPANFDVLNACYRQWLWSREDAYLDQAFMHFYRRSATDYVSAWDRNHDGLLGHVHGDGHMGIGTYDEDLADDVLTGADLVAAQFAGYAAYAALAQAGKQPEVANEFAAKARELKLRFDSKWWDAGSGRYFAALSEDGRFHPGLKASTGATDIQFPLYFGLTETGAKTKAALDQLEQRLQLDSATMGGIVGGVEGRTYLPDIFYKYGRSRAGYAVLVALMDPALRRREYPEVSYTVIGNLSSGLMGIQALPGAGNVETYPQLTAETGWAALHHAPVGGNAISVKHTGNRTTAFTNEAGPRILWRAVLPGDATTLLVDSQRVAAETAMRPGGGSATIHVIPVEPGKTIVVSLG